MQDLSNFSKALNTIYTKGEIANTVFKNRPLFAMIKKWEKFFGENHKRPLIYGNPNGRSADFSKALANRTNTKIAAFLITRNSNYSLFQISNEVVEASMSDEGSVLQALQTEIDGALNALGRDLSLAVYRSGSGVIGKVASTQSGSSTTITLEKADDIVTIEVGANLNTADAESGGTVVTTNIYVVSVDRDAGTFQVSASQGGVATTATLSNMTAGRFICNAGDYDAKLKGLMAWLPSSVSSSDSFFGLNRSVDRQRLAGIYKDNSSKPIEEALIDIVSSITRFGGTPDFCFLNPTEFQRLQLAIGTKAIWVDVKAGSEATYGFKALQIQLGNCLVKVVSDVDCQSGEGFL
jgi:hypothetical protein